MDKKFSKSMSESNSLPASSLNNYHFIDTHCHLEMYQFDNDREEIIQRAHTEHIESIINIGSDIESNVKALELADTYPNVFTSIGIHPHDARDFNDKIHTQLSVWAKHKKVVAIGETGLDYHYDNSPREVQRKVFVKHLELAKESHLPAVIHSREAKEDTLKILSDTSTNRGVLHCFSGDMDMAEKALSMGLYISFAGPVTFKNAHKLRKIVRIIPDDRLLIETDAPYLAPEPYRGKRNEPSFIQYTAETIAELRGVSIEDIARITTLNARVLFHIGALPEQGETSYKIRDSLYLNITNRCTNQCCFCVRNAKDFVKGHNLRLSREPEEDELRNAIGNPSLYEEVVFCGYGEPLLRLDLVKSLSKWIKQQGGKVRINTNGQGNLIYQRDIVPELKDIVDSLSISLDAHSEEVYNTLCRPSQKNAFNAVIDFARKAKTYVPEVTLTVVDVHGVDIDQCRKIAEKIGTGFRIRKLDDVG